jgi:hypothetical protein
MMDYPEYLESDHWRWIRAKIRRRARGWCERCKVNKRDDIHHLTYERVGYELLTDLIGICSYCHEYLHGKRVVDPAATVFTPEEIRLIREYAWEIEEQNWAFLEKGCERRNDWAPVMALIKRNVANTFDVKQHG